MNLTPSVGTGLLFTSLMGLKTLQFAILFKKLFLTLTYWSKCSLCRSSSPYELWLLCKCMYILKVSNKYLLPLSDDTVRGRWITSPADPSDSRWPTDCCSTIWAKWIHPTGSGRADAVNKRAADIDTAASKCSLPRTSFPDSWWTNCYLPAHSGELLTVAFYFSSLEESGRASSAPPNTLTKSKAELAL